MSYSSYQHTYTKDFIKKMSHSASHWADGDISHIPYALYSDPDIFKKEMELIFCSSSWSYVALDQEIPNSGDYRTTYIGNQSVIICRDEKGAVNGFVNRCAHRGVQFCKQQKGNTRTFVCPYHRWVYGLNGCLRGVPFIKGVNNQGGMPKDFDKSKYGLEKLYTHVHNGVIFASFDKNAPSFDSYLGETNLHYFNRVFDGRSLRVLGYSSQLIPANWKLLFENIKDPYHATLLHVFLATFGLFRADQKSQVKMDETGRHGLLISQKGEKKQNEFTKDIESLKEDFNLSDDRIVKFIKEHHDEFSVVMQTIWPNVIIQQQINTLAIRQIRPKTPRLTELYWTFFAYETDDKEMIKARLLQSNLMGASGLISIDDSEILKMTQKGIEANQKSYATVRMGGDTTHDEEHMVTEAAIRAFYKYYRMIMSL